MRYILYARKSSDREDRQIQSIPDQRNILQKLALSREVQIVREHLESRSAKVPRTRAMFEEMLASIEAGEAEGILCWHINRLSRNPIDSGRLQWLLQRGVIKSVLTPEREYLPDDNVLLMALESGMANQYILDLSKSVRRGLDEKARRGVWPYRPRIGYKFDLERRTVIADPIAFPLLKRAWALMLTNTSTVPEVLVKLDGWGYRFKGRKLSRSALYRMFSSEFYAGYFRHHGARIRGTHPAMVSETEFQQVQVKLRGPERIQPQRHEFAYTGLIRCGVCGCQITAERKAKRSIALGTRTYTYYHCTGRKGCSKKSVSEGYLDQTIAKFLLRCKLIPDFAAWATSELANDQEEDDRQLAAVHTARDSYRASVEQRLENLL